MVNTPLGSSTRYAMLVVCPLCTCTSARTLVTSVGTGVALGTGLGDGLGTVAAGLDGEALTAPVQHAMARSAPPSAAAHTAALRVLHRLARPHVLMAAF